ncbi:LuxR C-terminal-related transcriptional regulator [Streptomyces sp. NPDC050732]|uniref:LuxR C-terminal-related transcriptional regulator n=1 Tax=Streptomyces sp. NPDC050732 TaxID=3154632 RepID=UPI00341A3908
MTITRTPPTLTAREIEVMRLLAEGAREGEIGSRLLIRACTVKSYTRLVRQKLGTAGAAHSVDVCYELRLIALPAREPHEIELPPEQQQLIPLIARSLNGVQMAAETGRPLVDVRRDANALEEALEARSWAHLVTRARQYGLPTRSVDTDGQEAASSLALAKRT